MKTYQPFAPFWNSLWLGLALMGCESSSQPSASAPKSPVQDIPIKHVEALYSDFGILPTAAQAINELRLLCMNSEGATYDDFYKRCRCEEAGKSFVVDRHRQQGVCSSMQEFESGALFARKPTAYGVNTQTRIRSLGSEDDSCRLWDTMSRFFDRGGVLPFSNQIASGPASSLLEVHSGLGHLKLFDHLNIQVNTIRQLNQAYRLDKAFTESDSNGSNWEPQYLYEEDPELLPIALGDQNGLNLRDFRLAEHEDIFDTSSESRERLNMLHMGINLQLKYRKFDLDYPLASMAATQAIVSDAYHFYLDSVRTQGFQPQFINTPFRQACYRYCELEQNIEDVPGNLTMQWKRQYISFQNVNSRLEILERESGNAIATIFLNFSDLASMVLIHWKKISLPQKRVIVLPWLTDRNLRSLNMETFDRELDIEDSDTRTSQLENETKVSAAFCDDFDFNAPLKEKILYGPYRYKSEDGESLKGSLSGWLENERGNFREWLDERVSWRVTGDAIYYSGEHGNLVADVFSSLKGESKIATFSRSACFERIHAAKAALYKRGIRSVNVSITQSVDESVCKATVGPIVNDSPFLWVVAAGNTKSMKAGDYSCPQNLGNFPTLLKVSAVDQSGDFMADSSYRFSDIAALGTSVDGSEVGSSFAAPRVTAAASTLFEKFPQRNAEEIRLALLIGASFPEGKVIDVRSGGVVDLEKSERLLLLYENALRTSTIEEPLKAHIQELIKKRGEIYDSIVSPLVNQLFCQSDQPCRDSKQKMRILERSGFVVKP